MKKCIVLWLLCLTSYAQQRVVTSVDTTRNKIGAQFTLMLKAEVDTGTVVQFPRGRNMGQLEIIRSYKIDTVTEGGRWELIKKYGLTQFDSGRYTIPRLPVRIGDRIAYSDSIRVEVANVQVDTLKQKMYDIREIMPAESSSRWWWFLLLVLALAIAGYYGYRYYRNRPKRVREVEVYRTPIEKATGLLQQLEKKDLVRRGEVKSYYSELTDIARLYIEEAIHVPAMESTTRELIEKLKVAAVKKKLSIAPETVAHLETVLHQADMVKFAKERPQEPEIIDARQKIESAIMDINRSIPADTDDEELRNEAARIAREKELRRKKRRRVAVISGLSAAGVVILLFVLSQIGFTTVFSSKNQKLLEGEWIRSEYGNPVVSIETPEVLSRMDAKTVLQPDAIAVLKEFQMFSMGSPMDDLYILVSTIKFKKDTPVNLDTIVEGSIKDLEQKGASNILVKKDEFTTKAGISGIRAFGTMAVLDGVLKRSSKVYYEMLFFKQEQGVQQVTVWYPEGDEQGRQILERVVGSVELQVGAQ